MIDAIGWSALSALLLSGSASFAEPHEDELPRILFLTHSAGFVHGVVKRPSPEELSYAESQLTFVSGGRFRVDCTQDCGAITPENLANYDAVVFYTTGELPIPGGADVLVDWVAAGGAFVGVHSATDTLYESAAYMEMIGGAFDGHPWHEEITMTVEDPRHPSTAHLGDDWAHKDEIYQFRGWRRHPLNVLLSMQHDSVDVARGKRADRDYANAWWRDWGRGRVFYTALGHRPEVWEDARFHQHLLEGIEWSFTGRGYSAPPPTGAVVLFDGSGLDGWRHRSGADEAAWRLAAYDFPKWMEVEAGTSDLISRHEHGDALVHIEFSVPEMPEAEGQARGNSGVYLQGRYEVQVLDSFGLDREREPGDCGSIYGLKVADVDAYRPPGSWQVYDVEFSAPRFDAAGEKTANARMTVWLNGRRIHDDVEVPGPTGGALDAEAPLGPLLLQDHGDAVRFRNVWVLPRGAAGD